MRIGIDARMMGKGYGLGRYIEQLVLHLMEVDKENEYVLFVNEGKSLPLKGGDEGGRTEIQKSEFRKNGSSSFIDDTERPHPSPPLGKGGNFRVTSVNIPWYSVKEQVSLVPIIKREKVDLMHFPHWNVPLLYTDPFVVTIHDLIMYHYPRAEATTLGPVAYWIKDRAHRVVVNHAVKKAKHILVTSEFTKYDVHKTLGVPLERMTTIYQAPFGRNSKFQIPNSKKVLQDKHIQKPYVLYVGAAYPHKNVEGLLKAWDAFQKKYGDAYELVLVGKENYFWQRLNNGAIEQCNNVTYLGFVPDEELEVLYDNASLFVFPSLYEGFGLPPLEALARGVPVVSSNRSCLPEVLGEAALYADPESPEQFASTMYTGLTNKDTRFDLKQLAKEELKRYSWRKLAQQNFSIYKTAAR